MGTQTGRCYTKSGSKTKYESGCWFGVTETYPVGSPSATISTSIPSSGNYMDYTISLTGYTTGTSSDKDVTTITKYASSRYVVGGEKTFYWKKGITKAGDISIIYGSFGLDENDNISQVVRIGVSGEEDSGTSFTITCKIDIEIGGVTRTYNGSGTFTIKSIQKGYISTNVGGQSTGTVTAWDFDFPKTVYNSAGTKYWSVTDS